VSARVRPEGDRPDEGRPDRGRPGRPAEGHRREERGPPTVSIRDAAPGDLPRVIEVERACFTLPWSPASFRSLLGRDRVRFLVAHQEGTLLGHGVLWWVAREGELANLAVAPEARRRGVGALLLERLLAEAEKSGVRAVFLEVRASNDRAIALYRRRGFREVGRRRDYYSQPREDARVFRLDL